MQNSLAHYVNGDMTVVLFYLFSLFLTSCFMAAVIIVIMCIVSEKFRQSFLYDIRRK